MLKAIVRGHYDLQKLRIQIGNRIIANFRAKLKIPASERAEKAALVQIKQEFSTLPRIKSSKTFSGTPIIAAYPEYVLVKKYMDLLASEQQAIKEIKDIVNATPLWNSFLQPIKGVGPLMAGIILSEIDITKATTPQSLWKYAGLDVAEDGHARSRRKEHLISREYTDKEGKAAKKLSITYNPRLRSKLLGVLGPSLIKQKDPTYTPAYYNYKQNLETSRPSIVKPHRHRMALRYMVKKFVKHLHLAWRQLEDLSIPEKYDPNN